MKKILAILLFCVACSCIHAQKKVILNNFKSDFIFYDGLLAIENSETKKWGFIDTSGNIVIPFQWERTADIWLGLKNPKFGGGVCALYKMVGGAKRWYIVDKRGGQIALPATTIVVSNFNKDGYAIAIKRTGDKYKNKRVYINSRGVEVFPSLVSLEYGNELRVDFPPAFYDGIALFGSYRKYGYFDKQGRIIAKPVLVEAKDFSDGLAAVLVPSTSTSASRWGYINTKGGFAISPEFSKEVGSFSSGLALVTKTNGNQVFIDKTGAVRSKVLTEATSVFNGHAWVKFADEKEGKCWVIKVVDSDIYKVNEAPHFYMGFNPSILQSCGEYMLIKDGAYTKIYDIAGNDMKIWADILASDNIAGRGENNGTYKFIDIKKREYIISIEKSEF